MTWIAITILSLLIANLYLRDYFHGKCFKAQDDVNKHVLEFMDSQVDFNNATSEFTQGVCKAMDIKPVEKVH